MTEPITLYFYIHDEMTDMNLGFMFGRFSATCDIMFTFNTHHDHDDVLDVVFSSNDDATVFKLNFSEYIGEKPKPLAERITETARNTMKDIQFDLETYQDYSSRVDWNWSSSRWK